MISRLVRDRAWTTLTQGIYRLTPESWMQAAWAGLLLGGEGAVLGRSAAAHLHGWQKSPPTPITIFVPDAKRTRRDHRWQFIRSRRRSFGEPPRTRAAQTILDLAAVSTADELTSLLAEASAFGRLSPNEVLRLAAGKTRLRNRQALNETLGVVRTGALSPLERRYLIAVERAHGLPKADRQANPSGRFRTDGWYRRYGVIVELDGAAYHRGATRTKDLERDNLHRLSGLVTLRFNWQLVTSDPCGVANQVATALRLGGWIDQLDRCPRCSAADFAP